MQNNLKDCGLETLLEGDKAMFDRVYHELKAPIFTVIYRITQDRMLAEDIMHDFFLKLLQVSPSTHIKNPRAWCFQIARNLAIDSARKTKTFTMTEDIADDNTPMEDIVIERTDVDAAMRHLSLEEREIIALHINAGLKFREIAEITETPLGTVLWKYQKSIGVLRNQLNGGSR